MTTRRDQRQQIIERFAEMGIEAMHGKGGFWLRGHGHVSFAQARKMTGVSVPDELRRDHSRIGAYGDYAWVAKLNRVKG